MSDPLSPHSDDLREYFFSAPPTKEAFETIELRHAAFATPVRVVNDPNDLVATLEADAPANPGAAVTFSKCRFQFTQPESSSAAPSCDVEVLNVGGILMPYLDQAAGTPDILQLSFRLYLSDELTAPSYVLHGLTVKKVTANIFRVVGTAGFEDFLNRPFPRRNYTTAAFPGLAR